jgi:collagen type IV alpha-3-binding protein
LQGLAEKLAECDTFKDILCQQIDTLQSYFDACAEISDYLRKSEERSSPLDPPMEATPSLVTKELLLQHGLHAMDFKGEAITFKATTAGILATLTYCSELMGQREEQLKRRLGKYGTAQCAGVHLIDN